MQECGVGLVTLKQKGERWAFAAPPLKRSDISAKDLGPVLAALVLTASCPSTIAAGSGRLLAVLERRCWRAIP
jgi:hypothetical protein